MRNLERVLVPVALIVFTGTIALIVHNVQKPKSPMPPTTANTTCTTQKPCIEITAEDGTKYKLNDFRFMIGHCIAILSLPDNTARQLCGRWRLEWIGPDIPNKLIKQSV